MYFKITSVNGQFFWQLIKSDGSSLGQAPNIYTSLASIEADINIIKQWAATASIVAPASFAPSDALGVAHTSNAQHGGGKHPASAPGGGARPGQHL